jgi:hypothetical protein
MQLQSDELVKLTQLPELTRGPFAHRVHRMKAFVLIPALVSALIATDACTQVEVTGFGYAGSYGLSRLFRSPTALKPCAAASRASSISAA